MMNYIDSIDCYKRMSAKEHYLLYEFYLMNNKSVTYDKFRITEKLVNDYNNLPDEKKIEIAKKIEGRPEYIQFEKKFSEEPWVYDKAVIWGDRAKDEYYIDNLEKSHAFELFVDRQFKEKGIDIGLFYSPDLQYRGESAKGIEIKFDKRSQETKNYYIEYKEKKDGDGNWADSGILKKDNTKYFLCGTKERYHIFKKQILLDIYNKLINNERVNGAKLVSERTRGTSQGFIIFPELQKKICLSIDDVISCLKKEK